MKPDCWHVQLLSKSGHAPKQPLLVLCIAALMAASATAQADNTANNLSSRVTLPTTTVTANRIQDAERDNAAEMFAKPYTRDVVTAERIDQENIPDAKSAIAQVSGVHVTQSGGFYKQLAIRGLSGQRVSTLIDDIKISNQGFDHTGAGEINSTDVSSIERIEVVKGNPAVLYDSGASGGIVNIHTKPVSLTHGISAQHKHSYDAGYDKTSSSTQLSAATHGIGLQVIHSRNHAKDYKTKDADGVKFAIAKTNTLSEVGSAAPISVHDLGYKTESTSIKVAKDFLADGLVSLDHSDWQGNDMAFVHGQLVDDHANVILTHEKTRTNTGLTLQKESFGNVRDLNFRIAKQTQASQSTPTSPKQTQDSLSVIGSGQWLKALDGWGSLELTFGAELTQDEAVTAVYSEQDYLAAYINAAWLFDDWHWYLGARSNHWQTRQKLLEGANKAVAEQLLGISGITPEKSVNQPTWAAGVQYHFTDTQNVGLNVSRSYRNPDLLERYAFGGLVGGGLALKPEVGQHIEATYKYLDEHVGVTASAFYSDFDEFIWTKTIKQLTNPSGLERCVALKLCDPVAGEYNDHEQDFFSSYIRYYNAGAVTNQGAEVSASYMNGRHDATLGISYNQIKSDDVFVKSAAHPIALKTSYKYHFDAPFEPWLKLNGTYVTDEPHVRQYGGFNPYGLLGVYAGARFNWVSISLGVRNLTDVTYRPPYSALSGLERTWLGSVTLHWDSADRRAR